MSYHTFVGLQPLRFSVISISPSLVAAGAGAAGPAPYGSAGRGGRARAPAVPVPVAGNVSGSGPVKRDGGSLSLVIMVILGSDVGYVTIQLAIRCIGNLKMPVTQTQPIL